VTDSNQPRRSYRYYDLVMAAFVTVLLCSNLIGSSKVTTVFGFTFGTGILFFPLSYLFGDILTEVYGYANSRKVIWAGFAALAFAAFMSQAIIHLPAAGNWKGQAAYEAVYGSTWRVMLASFIAFWVGEFANSFVLAKLKLQTEGRLLWLRTIGSTIVGEGFDTLIFYPLAFYGSPNWPTDLLLTVMWGNYVVKVLWEVAATPVTYRVVAWLKQAEHEDYYDRETNFNPFSLQN
jgi:uncharacterized integral membrane protein (TIGR00697 family)